MEQAIPAAFGGNVQSKALESAGLFKMAGASGDKTKAANTQSDKDKEDSNAVVPFLQHLNQQMSRADKSSDNDSSNIDGKKITREQATSLLQRKATLKELQQALASLTQSGDTAKIDQAKDDTSEITFDELLKEMDLLEKNSAAGDVNDKDPLLAAALEQTGTEEKVLDGENKAIDLTNVASQPEEKSGNGKNEIKTTNNIGMSLNQPEQGGNDLLSGDKSSETASMKIAAMDLSSSKGTKSDEEQSDNLSIQSKQDDPSIEKEINYKVRGMERQTPLKTDEGTLQPERMISPPADQLSESAIGRIAANLTDLKEKNKTGNDIGLVGSGKEDNTAGNNSRSTIQEMKESQIGKDNPRFAEGQYLNTVNAKAENKAQADTIRAIIGEVVSEVKSEQRGKIISSEKGNDEIPSTGVGAASGGQAGTEKISDVSPDKIIGQITNEIKDLAANDGGRMKIILNPPSLGKLEMDVTVRNGKVEIVLVADNKDVQLSLNTHIDKLKGSLQNQGLTIDRCDVFMQDKREEYQQGFHQQAFNHQDRSRQDSNGRQERSEEEVKVSASAIISRQPGSVLRASTDNISLFA